jgi:hypothetical protein
METKTDYMKSAIKTAMEYAIFQHEVDKLLKMYSKYYDGFEITEEELKDDLKYIENICE